MKAKQYVIVLNAGTDKESIDTEYDTWCQAMDRRDYLTEFGEDCDIMKRLPNGELTTEY